MLLMILSAFAQDYESPSQEIYFSDSFDLFGGSVFDTGVLPASSPIGVRFHITPTGGVVADMGAQSDLGWPTALQHSLIALPGTGTFGVDTTVDVEFEVQIDVAGIFQSSLPVWSEQFDIVEFMDFETLVLPDSPEFPLLLEIDDPTFLDPFNYDISVVSGIADISLEVLIVPQLQAELAGERIDTTLGADVASEVSEANPTQLALPSGNPGEVELSSTYFANISTLFALDIVPSASLSTVIGDFDLLSFHIPVNILHTDELRAFEPVSYSHPLPALDPPSVTGFGEVLVGNLANAQVPLSNLGIMGLEGTARIEGSGAFSVFPEYFYANTETTDGVVVTFAPGATGERVATLVIESNDPSSPVLSIPLLGVGIEPVPPTPPPEPEPEPEVNDPTPQPPATVSTCGCASTGPSSLGWLFIAPILWARRGTRART